MFVESNREKSIENNYQINNRLIKMVRGLMYLSDFSDIHTSSEKIMRIFLDHYPRLLSNQEKQEMLSLVNRNLISRNTANISEEYFEIRFSIINKIHKTAVDLVYSNKKLVT